MALTVALAAGGTGGHLFPAIALASELSRRGHTVDLMTDPRAKEWAGEVAIRKIHIVEAASPSGGGILGKIRAAGILARGTLKVRRVLAQAQVDIVVGFGGYPTVPPVLAASLLGKPTIIHEANAVLGRANKLLATRATAIATAAAETSGLGGREAHTHHVGNPVRDAVLAASERLYCAPTGDETVSLLVFGGSQGAHVFSHLVPDALELLPDTLRRRLRLTQQVREDDLKALQHRLDKLSVQAEVAPFFADMADRIAQAHFVVCRAGASSISELSVIGRPALLVPYPHALDHDQRTNAAALMAAGGAIAIEEKHLTPARFADELTQRLSDPTGLNAAAEAAKSVGRPDAVHSLADLVEAIGQAPV